MKKMLASLLFFVLASQSVLAQNTPYISAISERSATVGESITISGLNFSNTNTNWLVTFGAQSVVADLSTNTIIQATVPAGATTSNIAVTNQSTGQMAYSREIFYISFGGAKNSFDKARLKNMVTVTTKGLQAQDICMCDFDKNGKNDMAISHVSANFVSVFTNASTVGNLNFTYNESSPHEKIKFAANENSYNVTCGDLNGDSWPDLVVSSHSNPDPLNGLGESGDFIFIFPNSGNGTISFESKIILSIPKVGNISSGDRRNPEKVAISDIDLDGKPEIIVTIASNGQVDIFKNITPALGTIAFSSTPVTFQMSGATNLFGLDVKDLNNDGLPDIGANMPESDNFYVLQNSSQPGEISFKSSVVFKTANNSGIRHLKFGDFNQDGLADVAIADRLLGRIHIFINTTTESGGIIKFNDEIFEQITGLTQPWGLDVGDMDGDGDLDIVAASNDASAKELYYISNKGTFSGSLFNTPVVIKKTTSNAKNIKVGDLDGDGKPDFAFTHAANAGATGDLGMLLNYNCITPVISPKQNLKICNGQAVTFDATITSSGYNYIWRDGSTQVQTSAAHTFVTTTAGEYTVLIDDPNCNTIVSNNVSVTIDPGAFKDPIISPVIPVCTNEEINIMTSKNGETDNVSFLWTGPNDFTSTLQSPVIASASPMNTGKYAVRMTSTDRGCISNIVSVDIEVKTVPKAVVINSDGTIFCDDGQSSIDLSIADFSGFGDYLIEWKRNNNSFDPAETGNSLSITESGDYVAVLTANDASNCFSTSAISSLQKVAKPVTSFTSDIAKCTDLAITFKSNATGVFALTNTWDFGDSNAGIGNTQSHAYSTAGEYTASLTATYSLVAADDCDYQPVTKLITISAPPTVDNRDLIISVNTADEKVYTKCPSGSIRLELANGPYTSQIWKLSSENFVEKNQSPNNRTFFRVFDEDELFATVTSNIGCVFDTDIIEVKNLPNAGLFIRSTSTITDSVGYGKVINMDRNQNSVELSVEGFGTDTTFVWETIMKIGGKDSLVTVPSNVFRFVDKKGIKTDVFPIELYQKIYLEGNDIFGCLESDSLTLVTPSLIIDNKFSPNGDGINDCWEISNARGNSCAISIFDAKGRRIKQISNSSVLSNDCIWDGYSDGKSKMPDGIYYYTVKCSGGRGMNSGGTILLVR